MGKFTVLSMKLGSPNGKLGYDVYWQQQKIYSSNDELYIISEVIINYMVDQGWKFVQMVPEKNFAHMLLIFSK